MIDWMHFTPWRSFGGGLLIGIAAAVLVWFNGMIAGISGIAGGLLRPGRKSFGWRAAFLGGLIGAPILYALTLPLPPARIDAGMGTLIAAGFLVGVGTRYGSGCTSGHGVCGLSRLSPRSLVATASFMLAGFATVFALRHLFA